MSRTTSIWLIAALAGTVVAVHATPGAGQAPPPPCPAGTQVPPDRFQFADREGTGDPQQSLAATHGAELFISVPNSGLLSVSDPAIQVSGPPGLQTTVSHRGDPTLLYADFVPTTPGTVTFTATWTQLSQPDGPPCTASASLSLNVTAPTPVRASRALGYSIDHRAGKPGRNNEFVLSARVSSDTKLGDRSPIRMAVRAVTRARRPTAKAPVTSVTLDPLNIPPHGVRASSALVRLTAGQYADSASVYEFKVGVLAYPRHGRGHTRRGAELILIQGSRTLATYRYVTTCDSPGHGGLDCTPRPKGAEAPRPVPLG
jgi:hypothetical protein